MLYAEIIENEHFIRLAGVIRPVIGPWGPQRFNRPGLMPLYEELRTLTFVEPPTFDAGREKLVTLYAELLHLIVEQEPKLRYTEDDLAWLVAAIDSPDAQVVLSLLLAVASCREEMVTPAEAAERTGMSESHWRNTAAAGGIPGAEKRGKQWLIPVSVLS